MEIKFLNKMGVPSAEIEAHQKIQKAFNSSQFSRDWLGYASFKLARESRGSGDEDFDLVLVTHTNIIAIELKNWRGKKLLITDNRWCVDDSDRGSSPLKLINEKARRLKSALEKKCSKIPFITSYVVIQDGIETIEYDANLEQAANSVITLSELLSWSDPATYKKIFYHRPRFNIPEYYDEYRSFFMGSSCTPREYSIEGYKLERLPTYVHPNNIYSEFLGVEKTDINKHGLLRVWNFSVSATDFLEEIKRSTIALKEKRIFELISDANEELITSMLRPIGNANNSDVTLDFTEVYSLPSRVLRLRDFKNKELSKLNINEKYQLIKNLLNKFSEFHKLQIAHRDIGENFIWLERSGRIIISGFPCANYEGDVTDPNIFSLINSNKVALDENSIPIWQSYEADVHALGAIVKTIIQGNEPNLNIWTPPLIEFVEKSTSKDPSKKFKNAKEMLEAFNSITISVEHDFPGLDKFDIYQAKSKQRDYTESITLIDTDELLMFRDLNKNCSVKVWHGINPTPQDKEFAFKLLSFLERAKVLKNGNITCIPNILDFGLTTRKSLILVSEWVDGLNIVDWSNQTPTLIDKLIIARKIIESINAIHQFGIPHGNITPSEILISETNAIFFTSAISLDGTDSHFEYLPKGVPENITPIQKDCYLIAAIVRDLLAPSEGKTVSVKTPPKIKETITRIFEEKYGVSLEPLLKAIIEELDNHQGQSKKPLLTKIRNSKFSGPLIPDNGQYHLSINVDRASEKNARIQITGISHQLNLIVDIKNKISNDIWISEVESNQVNNAFSRRLDFLSEQIYIEDFSANEASQLVDVLLEKNGIKQFINNLGTTNILHSKPSSNLTQISDNASHLPEIEISALWKNLLAAEEEVLPLVIVEDSLKVENNRDYELLVSCHNDGGSFEFDRGERVDVEFIGHDGSWRTLGELNLRESSFNDSIELAIGSIRIKSRIKAGDKLRLISTLAKYSFNRRSLAVKKILANNAAIPDLINYFDPTKTNLSINEYAGASDLDINQYSSSIKVVNDSQIEAFKKVTKYGPISLLQGPPGTGKTWFIASLIHYLINIQKTRRILLTSQSHEAVNNALEKALEIFNEKGLMFNAVRLGNENDVSDSIKHLHNASIENAYREKFKAEQKERIICVAEEIGLPKKFAEDFIDLSLELSPIAHKINKISNEIKSLQEDDEELISSLKQKKNRLLDIFFQILENNFLHRYPRQISPEEILKNVEDDLCTKYDINSPNSVDRLKKVIQLSNTWLRSLGTTSANFVEFLASSRTVVAGTLVGLGKPSTGAIEGLYDWVIVDEAGRATSSELAIAMQAGHRVLLVGDHKQLPPTYSDEVKSYLKEKYNVNDDSAYFQSDFERIFNSDYGSKIGTSLLEQYRMVPNIGNIVSEIFYENKLIAGRATTPLIHSSTDSQLNYDVAWIDTSELGIKGYENSSINSPKKWNDSEAIVTMNLLRRIVESNFFEEILKKENPENRPLIGIICMYSEQRRVLEKMRSQASWLNNIRKLIKIDTVDSYQGKENKIIIISTVRNNETSSVGFLKSPNRINVALSRAMDQLFIVGSKTMWKGKNSDLPLGKVLKKIELGEGAKNVKVISAKEFVHEY